MDLKTIMMGLTISDIITYSELRDMAIKGADVIPGGLYKNQKAVNNTGLSRQQRRAREREREKEPVLSGRLTFALAQCYEGQGLFMRRGRYDRGWPSERREPSADYSGRYKALFPVLPG